jgi:hypothetical protein
MDERINRGFYVVLFGAMVFFSWGFLELSKALHYQPQAPSKAPLNRYTFTRRERLFPIERYQSLLNGDLFFGKLVVPPPPSQPAVRFETQLTVIGITKGHNTTDGYAVVGLQSSGDRQTWIVTAGSVVGGERILKVGNGYIEVENKTGVGRMPLRD